MHSGLDKGRCTRDAGCWACTMDAAQGNSLSWACLAQCMDDARLGPRPGSNGASHCFPKHEPINCLLKARTSVQHVRVPRCSPAWPWRVNTAEQRLHVNLPPFNLATGIPNDGFLPPHGATQDELPNAGVSSPHDGAMGSCRHTTRSCRRTTRWVLTAIQRGLVAAHQDSPVCKNLRQMVHKSEKLPTRPGIPYISL